MKLTEAAWLAGIIDGEGYIRVHPPEIQVTNCDRELLEKVLTVTGCGAIRETGRPRSRLHRQGYRWYTRRRSEVVRLLTATQKWLITKRAKAGRLLQEGVK